MTSNRRLFFSINLISVVSNEWPRRNIIFLPANLGSRENLHCNYNFLYTLAQHDTLLPWLWAKESKRSWTLSAQEHHQKKLKIKAWCYVEMHEWNSRKVENYFLLSLAHLIMLAHSRWRPGIAINWHDCASLSYIRLLPHPGSIDSSFFHSLIVLLYTLTAARPLPSSSLFFLSFLFSAFIHLPSFFYCKWVKDETWNTCEALKMTTTSEREKWTSIFGRPNWWFLFCNGQFEI